eukprot:scaffold116406_cov30-Tisochrysis_lutea.AAC.2
MICRRHRRVSRGAATLWRRQCLHERLRVRPGEVNDGEAGRGVLRGPGCTGTIFASGLMAETPCLRSVADTPMARRWRHAMRRRSPSIVCPPCEQVTDVYGQAALWGRHCAPPAIAE